MILGQNWTISPRNITFCRLLVMSYISYFELPIGKSLYHCIITYKYNNYCPISRVLLHLFYLFNPKQLKSPIRVRHCPILVKKTPPIIMKSREFVLQDRNGTISRNMDTTKIFPFLAIFEQNLTVLHQNIIYFIYPALQLAISYTCIQFYELPTFKMLYYFIF